ncbi:general stress protein 26 [Humitalea rosea]|uniref:General stress protein 26 n=1 Tax=Humitalea rosea TaxID=990373 RepID=A0A2W7IRM0_9PROT|nr:pyridoxamine 5'-phosphate oxidase family protein [Humitalea rosea]PZW48757.1 general stress protein 26 [Humitalea rosea]
MTQPTDPAAARAKALEMIKDIRVAMLVTHDAVGGLRARPMHALQTDPDGTLWFFTKGHTGKTSEIAADREVLLTYANPANQDYVSVQGTAAVRHDPAMAERLWTEEARPWFPEGAQSPDLALLQVTAISAEYWDGRSGAMAGLFGSVRAALTGEPEQTAESGTARF